MVVAADIALQRRRARTIISAGAAAALVGVAIMVHGELNFGDGVLVAGLVLLVSGAIWLSRLPAGVNNVD